MDQQKRPPMQPGIRDELFWNREVQAAVVTQGQARGLNIRAYTPPSISIANDDDLSTNWSKAKVFSERGEYVLEIHFDAYRPHGFGSGLIPVLPNVRELNVVDESLAQAFGRTHTCSAEALAVRGGGSEFLKSPCLSPLSRRN